VPATCCSLFGAGDLLRCRRPSAPPATCAVPATFCSAGDLCGAGDLMRCRLLPARSLAGVRCSRCLVRVRRRPAPPRTVQAGLSCASARGRRRARCRQACLASAGMRAAAKRACELQPVPAGAAAHGAGRPFWPVRGCELQLSARSLAGVRCSRRLGFGCGGVGRRSARCRQAVLCQCPRAPPRTVQFCPVPVAHSGLPAVCGTGRKTRARTTKFTTYRTHVSHVTSKVGQWPIFEDLFLDFFSLI